jgi:hypothetical protein
MRYWILAISALSAAAQWLDYPTPGVPRLPNGQPNLAAPAPRGSDGKPDFSGLWDAARTGAAEPVSGAGPLAAEFWNVGSLLKEPLPYQPWARELYNTRRATNGKDNPNARCLPLGPLPMLSNPFPRRVVQVPGFMAILYEKNTEYRQIFTDGRPLPVDPQPAYNGYSSGKWEGDTLVVQTIGLRDGLWLDEDGNPLTDAARITERFRRPNYGSMEIEVTVDDRKAYTAPWTIKIQWGLKLNADLMEYVCLENEQDISHMVGK